MNHSGYAQVGSIVGVSFPEQGSAGYSKVPKFAELAAMMATAKEKQMLDGNKPIVVCGGVVTEAKDMDDAQRIAEREAHAKSTDAYVLKPVRRVAPKREVVTVDLT